MENYLSLDESANYLGVSVETIKRYIEKGTLPFYKLERSIRFKREDLDKILSKNFEVLLTRGLRAAVRHSCACAEGMDAWRVIIVFQNIIDGKRFVVPFGPEHKFTEYYVWITGEYLEDFARLSPDIYGAEKFALKYIKDRFEETKNESGERFIDKIIENKVCCSEGKCIKNEQLVF